MSYSKNSGKVLAV